MSVTLFRKLLVLCTPLFLLLFAAMAIPYIGGLPPAKYELALLTPYLISITGMFLAIHFHRGRPFFALLLLASGYRLCRTLSPAGIQGVEEQSLFAILTLFIPANLMLLALMREKGILTAAGRLRLSFFACQAGAALFLYNNKMLLALPPLFHSLQLTALFAHTPLPQLSFLTFGLALLATLMVAIIRQTPIDSGLFGALASFFVACAWLNTPNILVAFSSSAALIITISILQDSYNMAFRDELTGIPSRRALNEQMHGIGRSYAVAMIDIDHFKKFNDTYGHDVGDQVLRLVAKKLQTVGGGGKTYRYGGEEFTILFPRKNAKETLEHLEAIRRTIAEYPLRIRQDGRPQNKQQGKQQRGRSQSGLTTHVTVSIGVADSGNGELERHEVIKIADKALYRAKNRGRNQVCH